MLLFFVHSRRGLEGKGLIARANLPTMEATQFNFPEHLSPKNGSIALTVVAARALLTLTGLTLIIHQFSLAQHSSWIGEKWANITEFWVGIRTGGRRTRPGLAVSARNFSVPRCTDRWCHGNAQTAAKIIHEIHEINENRACIVRPLSNAQMWSESKAVEI